jgi:hypothetical protein
MWKQELKKESDLLVCTSIKSTNDEVEIVNWNDLKEQYSNARDKKQFIKDFQKTWFEKRESTVAKEQNCLVDQVILERTKFLLLGHYLILTSDENRSHLKYYNACYKRFNELHETIGKKILLLPMPTNFFTAHRMS